MVRYRVRKDDFLAVAVTNVETVIVGGQAQVQYDDGSWDTLKFNEKSIAPGGDNLVCTNRIDQDGWVFALQLYYQGASAPHRGTVYARTFINSGEDVSAPNVLQTISSAYIRDFHVSTLGVFEPFSDYFAAYLFATLTQGNAGGGAVVVEIQTVTNAEFIVYGYRAVNSGTNGISVAIEDGLAGNVITQFAGIGSAAGTNVNGPTYGSTGAATGGTAGSANPLGILVRSSEVFLIKQTGAGAQNDTFTVGLLVLARQALPTATKASSTNPANVTVTAGSLTLTIV